MWGAEKRLTGRHVLLMLLGFFGAVAAANAVFIYLAVSSFPGLETENAYARGLAYNETLRDAEAQRKLGWSVTLDHAATEGGGQRLTVSIRDRAGVPLADLAVAGVLRRPTHEGMDQSLDFRPLGAGRYAAEPSLPAAGQWDIRLSATARDGAFYLLERRLWLK